MPDLGRSDSMSLNDPGNANVPVPDAVQGVTGQEDFELTQMQDTAGSQKTVSPLEKLEELSDEELSARARRIMGPHTSLDAFSQAKFSQHFQNGQLFMTAGRYYDAANSFNLALMYKPNDPSCLAGKGHALFAAGEYVSSALFISRALEVCPQYTQTEVNLATILGGNERIEKRIADVEQWLARSGSDQLGFLLSYVYYRTGKLDKAKLAVEIAYDKTPQSQSIRVLKAAIDEKLTTQ
jgi:tetratricopeptide (TPR) repeat protein